MSGEVWLPAPGYEGFYEVSNEGRIRSLRWDPPRILKPAPNHFGYPCASLRRADKKAATKKLHRLICHAFHGPCPPGMETAHLDGDPTNARADNLKWATHTENASHRIAHGTVLAGEKHPRAKLTDAQVVALRAEWAANPRQSQGEIARRLGVSRPTVCLILSGRKWKHLTGAGRHP